jgi:hypothetical protein
MDEDRYAREGQLPGGSGVVGMPVRADDPNELRHGATVDLDDRGDPRPGSGVPAVNEGQLRLKNEVGFDPSELDRFDVGN